MRSISTLKRSQSISSPNTGDTGRISFPGPLLPAVRRLNSEARLREDTDNVSGDSVEEESSSRSNVSVNIEGFNESSGRRRGPKLDDLQLPMRPKAQRIQSLPSEQEMASISAARLEAASQIQSSKFSGNALTSSDDISLHNLHKRRSSGPPLALKEDFNAKNKRSEEPVSSDYSKNQILGDFQSSSGNSTLVYLPKPTPAPLTQLHRSYAWPVTIVLLSVLSSLVVLYALAVREQATFLETEVFKMKKELHECTVRAENCGVLTRNEKSIEPIKERDVEEMNERGVRRYALYVSLFFLAAPFLFYKFLDEIPKLGSEIKDQTAEEEVRLSTRLAYQVDVLFSSFSYMKPIALLLATLALILVGGLALYAVSRENIWDSLWRAWTYVADSGNHADNVEVAPRVVSLCISLGGLLIFALMLGLVSDAISEKVDSFRKGRSEVIERNHTLILGWSDKMGSLLKQLSIANQSLGGGVVVVLSEREKEEMELDIARLEFDFLGTSVICRSGSPLIMADLKKVSVSKARSIIVLAEVENADQSDARALRVVLSLAGVKEGLRGHVVVELSDLDNEPLVKLVGGEMVETVVAHDVIGRLMIQCARQPGLAQIWEDILGFDNAEFYVKRWPELDGMPFKDVLISFSDAVPCGLRLACNGRILLNPEDEHILCEGDEVLVIAEDDDTYAPGPLPKVKWTPNQLDVRRRLKVPKKMLLCGWRRDVEDMITVGTGCLPKILSHRKYPEKLLFCGWRRDMDDMIMVLEAFLAPGSELWMFSEVPEEERDRKLKDGGLNPDTLENIRLVHRVGNAVIRRHLEMLPLETFDSILILADEALEESVVKADSRSLATLLLIRDIQSKRLPYREGKAVQYRHAGSSQTSWIREMQQASNKSIIISEILDSRTRHLVSVSKIGDYVLSNELVSMALAMVAEDKQINRVLEELFSEEGNELFIRSAELYVYDQEELSFYEMMMRARKRHEIVIGYREASAERAVINPSNKALPRKWSVDDVLVIISEDE